MYGYTTGRDRPKLCLNTLKIISQYLKSFKKKQTPGGEFRGESQGAVTSVWWCSLGMDLGQKNPQTLNPRP